MKNIFTVLLITLIATSCSRSEFELPEPQPQPKVELPAPTSYFKFSINGQSAAAETIVNQRSASAKTLLIKGSNQAFSIEIPVEKILQTGNSTGLILSGMYTINYSRLHSEGSNEQFVTTAKTLWLYSDNPLTDSIVTGRFSFDAEHPVTGEKIKITDGEFRIIF